MEDFRAGQQVALDQYQWLTALGPQIEHPGLQARAESVAILGPGGEAGLGQARWRGDVHFLHGPQQGCLLCRQRLGGDGGKTIIQAGSAARAEQQAEQGQAEREWEEAGHGRSFFWPHPTAKVERWYKSFRASFA